MNTATSPNLWTVVPAMGAAQIISWGSLCYAIAVLGEPMRTDLKVSDTVLYGAFTLSLLASGAAAPFVGKFVDDRGGRWVLSLGSLIAAGSMFVLSASNGPLTLLLGWLVAGLAMAACLYDPAFMALSQFAGTRYRTGVTAVTLFGGFASTVFWPLSQVLMLTLGWRQTFAAYGLMHLLICLPLHWWFIPPMQGHSSRARALPGDARAVRAAGPAFVWLASAFALAAFIVSIMSVQLIGLLKSQGLDDKAAVLVGALIGPMQVAGRIVEFTFARRIRPTTAGRMSFALMLIGLTMLCFVHGPSPLAFMFAAVYGWSNGVMTIVRGTVPAELFGHERYGELLGRLARPAFVARAIAPAAFAGCLAAGLSLNGALAALAVWAAFGWLAYELARSSHKKGRGTRPEQDGAAVDIDALPP